MTGKQKQRQDRKPGWPANLKPAAQGPTSSNWAGVPNAPPPPQTEPPVGDQEFTDLWGTFHIQTTAAAFGQQRSEGRKRKQAFRRVPSRGGGGGMEGTKSSLRRRVGGKLSALAGF